MIRTQQPRAKALKKSVFTALDVELLRIIDGLIGPLETRNDVIHRLLATHPQVNRKDLVEVPRKPAGRPREQLAAAK